VNKSNCCALSLNRVKLANIMGDYKGRLKLKLRKKRTAKAEKKKSLAASKAASPAVT
jgi:hypothetical protein